MSMTRLIKQDKPYAIAQNGNRRRQLSTSTLSTLLAVSLH